MEIINMKIQTDLCEMAIEEGLRQLESKDINKVFLLASSSYKFTDLFAYTSGYIGFPVTNIDTSEVLEKDSWLLIDYSNRKIFYSSGSY